MKPGVILTGVDPEVRTLVLQKYVLACKNADLANYYTIRSHGYTGNLPLIIVSDLRQVFGFLRVLRFPPAIKLTAMI
jgi:hypothetical protein